VWVLPVRLLDENVEHRVSTTATGCQPNCG